MRYTRTGLNPTTPNVRSDNGTGGIRRPRPPPATSKECCRRPWASPSTTAHLLQLHQLLHLLRPQVLPAPSRQSRLLQQLEQKMWLPVAHRWIQKMWLRVAHRWILSEGDGMASSAAPSVRSMIY